MSYKGIDVSYWNGNIDWTKVKAAGIQFAMLRGGYGTNGKDSKFEQNYKGAKTVGVPMGVYHYSYAKTVEAAKQEAKFCLSYLKGKQFEYPIAFDIEDSSQRNLGKATITAITKAFCETVEKAGYYVAIYSNLDWLRNRLDLNILKSYDIWLAQWASKPTYSGSFGMWQYADNGKLNGISGNVDMNISYKDYATLIKAAGMNGYKKATKPTVQTTKKAYSGKLPSIKNGMWLGVGDKGEQVKRLQSFLNWYSNYKLIVDGIFGAKTEAAVKAFQKAEGLTVDGQFGVKSLAKAKTIKK